MLSLVFIGNLTANPETRFVDTANGQQTDGMQFYRCGKSGSKRTESDRILQGIMLE